MLYLHQANYFDNSEFWTAYRHLNSFKLELFSETEFAYAYIHLQVELKIYIIPLIKPTIFFHSPLDNYIQIYFLNQH